MEKNRIMECNFITSKDRPWTVIASSSSPYLASRCDKIVLMSDGEIVKTGNFKEMAGEIKLKTPEYA